MHRMTNRASLVEVLLPAGLGRNDRLDKISNLLDWSALEGMLSGVYAAPKGRPSYPPLLMVKVLLLEQWYNLSDPEMEAALGDRLSFRRFVGLGLEDATPDHSTISRFRKELTQRGLGEALFGEVGRQLEVRGMVLKEGTLLDATLVEAQVRKPPAGSGLGRRSDQDPDADWTRKYGRSYFGYKVHLGVDEGSGLIRQAVLTSAKVSDSEIAAPARAEVQARIGAMTRDGALACLSAGDVPCAPVRTVPEILADPHFRDRGALRPMRNAAFDGEVDEVVAGFPVLFDGKPLPDVPGAPSLGMHNAEVLAQLCGIDDDGLTRLHSEGVI